MWRDAVILGRGKRWKRRVENKFVLYNIIQKFVVFYFLHQIAKTYLLSVICCQPHTKFAASPVFSAYAPHSASVTNTFVASLLQVICRVRFARKHSKHTLLRQTAERWSDKQRGDVTMNGAAVWRWTMQVNSVCCPYTHYYSIANSKVFSALFGRVRKIL